MKWVSRTGKWRTVGSSLMESYRKQMVNYASRTNVWRNYSIRTLYFYVVSINYWVYGTRYWCTSDISPLEYSIGNNCLYIGNWVLINVEVSWMDSCIKNQLY